MSTPEQPAELSTGQVADLLDVSPNRVRYWARQGLRSRKTDTGRWMIDARALDDPLYLTIVTGRSRRPRPQVDDGRPLSFKGELHRARRIARKIR